MSIQRLHPQTVSLSGLIWRRFLQHKLAVAALMLMMILVALTLLAPLLSPTDPLKTNLRGRYQPPSATHPLGTDNLGRDMLTRILYGGRVSLAVGGLAVFIAVGIGTLLGALAGFHGGIIDNLLMRLVDLMLALPRIFMLILVTVLLRGMNSAALQTQGGVPVIIVVIGLLSWMSVARVVRASFLALKTTSFIEAARAAGATNRRLMWRHLLPNAASPIIVAATLGVANAIIAESGLSFLGLGVQPPTPTWGNMLTNAQDEMLKGHWWMAIFPGLMIFITAIAMNYIGDGLRDALDPYKN